MQAHLWVFGKDGLGARGRRESDALDGSGVSRKWQMATWQMGQARGGTAQAKTEGTLNIERLNFERGGRRGKSARQDRRSPKASPVRMRRSSCGNRRLPVNQRGVGPAGVGLETLNIEP